MSFAPSRAFLEVSAPSRVAPADAFRRARATFQAGEKLDIRRLAEELGVPRGTLYRWIGDRDRLLADILWVEAQEALQHVRSRSRLSGLERIVELVGAFTEILANSASLQAFLRHEDSRGLALITSSTGGVRPRIVNAVEKIIEEEQQAGAYAPPAAVGELADGFVTLVEHHLYNDVINGFRPDPKTAQRLGRLMLRED